MKRIIFLISGVFFFSQAKGQSSIDTVRVNDEMYIRLEFTEPVLQYHISNPNDFFVEIKGNNLFIQALDQYALESNLYVGTKQFSYDYFVKYQKEITKYKYSTYKTEDNLKASVSYKQEQTLNKLAEQNPLNGKKDAYIRNRNMAFSSGMFLLIKGIYIQDDYLYFLFLVENRSSIDYDIKELNFFVVQDKELKSKSLTQEKIEPVKIYENVSIVKAKTKKYVTVAFEKFTLNDRNIIVSLLEKGGERNINLPIKNELIIKSRILK